MSRSYYRLSDLRYISSTRFQKSHRLSNWWQTAQWLWKDKLTLLYLSKLSCAKLSWLVSWKMYRFSKLYIYRSFKSQVYSIFFYINIANENGFLFMNHLQFFSYVFFKIVVFEIECVWLISSKIINLYHGI